MHLKGLNNCRKYEFETKAILKMENRQTTNLLNNSFSKKLLVNHFHWDNGYENYYSTIIIATLRWKGNYYDVS